METVNQMEINSVNYEIEDAAARAITASFVGTITAYGGDNAPTGWLLCNGQEVSRETYANLFAVIGTKFGAGDNATTFNLPDLRACFPEGKTNTETVGTKKAAGLPNITGSTYGGDSGGKFGDCSLSSSYRSGAITTIPFVTNKGVQEITWNGRMLVQNIQFNASYSNAIYGRSSTVQPPALLVNYIIKY